MKGPHRLSAGDKFTVGMTQYGLPYKITSTVTAKVPFVVELLGMQR